MMNDRELAAMIDEWAEQGLNDDMDEVSNERQRAYDYYMQEPYGDEKEGYSSTVTGEVMETVEWAKPSLIRTFLTGRPVSFRPSGHEDRDAAEQEADAVNWVIREQNDCFSEHTQWFTDALLYPNAYLKVWWDEREEWTFEQYEGLTQEQIDALMLESDLQVLNVEAGESVTMPQETPDGVMAVEVPTFSITLKAPKNEPGIRYAATPPEEVRVSANHTTLNLDDAEWVLHEPKDVTRSDLVAMGYDVDTVMGLESVDDDLSDGEKTARRDTVDENDGLSDLPSDPMMERVEYIEAYCRVDYDEDGYSERRKVCKSGSTILYNDYDDYQPFCTLACMIQSHRHIGRSLGQVAMPLQRENSTLVRQGLDNAYRTNRPRAILGDSIDRDEWDNYIPHGGVSGDPSDYAPEVVPVIVQHLQAWMQLQDERQQATTGISKHAMGLDADTLAQSTMGAYLEAAGASSQRLEMLVRTFAETGVSQLAQKTHYLLRKHQDAALSIELNGEWIDVHPREWKERKHMSVNVGIGIGSHRERAAASAQILELQREGLEMGLTTPDRVFNTIRDLLAALGKDDASGYFLDPASPEGQALAQQRAQSAQMQQQQQEEIIRAQVQAQVASIRSQFESTMAKVMADVRKQQQENERKWTEMELKAAVDVIGRGVDAAQVVPMPQQGAGGDD